MNEPSVVVSSLSSPYRPLNILVTRTEDENPEEVKSYDILVGENGQVWQRQCNEIVKECQDWQKRCNEIVKEFQTLKKRRIDSETKKKTNAEAKKVSHIKGELYNAGHAGVPKFGQWNYSFQKLLKYREKHGHCLVPCEFDSDPSLARWVKRQRYQYYLMIHRKKSSMTQERVKVLDEIGFIWQAQDALWQERFHELLKFKKEHGHCSVPTTYTSNQKLATWVKFQRRQYRLHLEGRPSYISDERIATLEKHGFQWAFFLKDVKSS